MEGDLKLEDMTIGKFYLFFFFFTFSTYKVASILIKKIINSSIGSPGIIVEVDESKFGKRKVTKNCQGRKVDGVWVVGGVERTQKEDAF